MGRNGNFKDLTGQRFGYLVALHRTKRSAHQNLVAWKCRCDCGQEVVVRGDRLRNGNTKACTINGHRWLGYLEERGLLSTTDYKSEHQSWESMWQRCKRKNHVKYKRYGAAGITVCDRWKSFKNFVEDMGRKPTPQHTIDRYPNQKGNYEPGNCRWATKEEQARNKQNNVFVEYEGERVLLIDVVKKLGLSRGIVYNRLKLGWPLDEALQEPVRTKAKKATK